MTVSDLVAAEDEVARRIGPVAAAAPATVRGSWGFPDDDVGPEYRALGADPAFVAHAQAVLVSAAARGAAVGTGAVPFVADGAFTPEEARAVACGLDTRRTILRHVLAELAAADRGRVTVDARHVVVDEYRVHLTTGRVTRDGDPVDVAPSGDPALWMPVSDPLLSEVVGLVVALLHR